MNILVITSVLVLLVVSGVPPARSAFGDRVSKASGHLDTSSSRWVSQVSPVTKSWLPRKKLTYVATSTTGAPVAQLPPVVAAAPTTPVPATVEQSVSTGNSSKVFRFSGAHSEATFRYVQPPVSPFDRNGVVLLNALRPDHQTGHHQGRAEMPVYSDHGRPLPLHHHAPRPPRARPHHQPQLVDYGNPPVYSDFGQGPEPSPQPGYESAGYAPPLVGSGVSYSPGHPLPPPDHPLPPPPPSTYAAPTLPSPPEPTYKTAATGLLPPISTPLAPPPSTAEPYRVIPFPTPLSSLVGPPPGMIPAVSYTEPEPDYNDVDYGIPGIPGIPWKDYPLYGEVPKTGFDCGLTKYAGFYADIDTGCQVWHYCQLDGRHDAFLCPNGTVFDQETRVCNWWYNVRCQEAPYKYGVNADLYREPIPGRYQVQASNYVQVPVAPSYGARAAPHYPPPPMTGSSVFYAHPVAHGHQGSAHSDPLYSESQYSTLTVESGTLPTPGHSIDLLTSDSDQSERVTPKDKKSLAPKNRKPDKEKALSEDKSGDGPLPTATEASQSVLPAPVTQGTPSVSSVDKPPGHATESSTKKRFVYRKVVKRVVTMGSKAGQRQLLSGPHQGSAASVRLSRVSREPNDRKPGGK